MEYSDFAPTLEGILDPLIDRFQGDGEVLFELLALKSGILNKNYVANENFRVYSINWKQISDELPQQLGICLKKLQSK